MSKLKRSLLYPAIFALIGTLSFSMAICQPLPSFQMQLSDGKTFSSKNISPAQPLILIYFAPDCEHCQVLMDAFFKRVNEFKGAQILMATFKPINEVADFESHYQTHKYKNIKVGTEIPIFLFRTYYQLMNTPFTALYDKHGKLVASYKKETPVDELIKRLKQLK